MSAVTPRVSSTFQDIDQFRHRDDRGGTIKHNGLQSKTTEEAARQLWRRSPGWPDKNGDGTYDVSYEFLSAPADKKLKRGGRSGFTSILENQRKQTELSLQSIADVANVKFNEGPRTVKSEGHIAIGNYGQRFDKNNKSIDAQPHTELPDNKGRGGAVWFVNNAEEMSVPKAHHGDAGRHTITHELGHAMGLTHPGNYNGILDRSKIDSHEDSQSHSVMSYRGERTTYANHGGFRASAPQLDDISAYQSKYGANHQTRKDDTTYGFNSNTDRDFLSVNTKDDKMLAAIWDGGGNDTLDFSGYVQDQKISLKEGTFSDVGALKGNVSIAYGATIESAIGGSGNDWLIGNAANNELRGGDGKDVLYGAEGADRLWGGKGNDTFVYGKINESSAAAPDRIEDFVSGQDKVDVSGIRVQLGDKPLQFVSRFSGASGEAIVAYDRRLNLSTLQIAGEPNDPTFVLQVQGELRRSDIVS